MPIKHTAREGDSTIKLSEVYGFSADTIWHHADNAKLRNNRSDMNQLLPGDVVTIPDKTLKEVAIPTEQRHRFRRTGIPAIYRLQIFAYEEPRANQNYRLVVDGKTLEGTTDSEGILEAYIPAEAQEGELVIGEDDYTILISFGTMGPIEEIVGIQKRLNNLGYDCGEPDGELNDATRAALRKFQQRFELEETGEANDATTKKLEEVHDTPNDFPEDDADSGTPNAASTQDVSPARELR